MPGVFSRWHDMQMALSRLRLSKPLRILTGVLPLKVTSVLAAGATAIVDVTVVAVGATCCGLTIGSAGVAAFGVIAGLAIGVVGSWLLGSTGCSDAEKARDVKNRDNIPKKKTVGFIKILLCPDEIAVLAIRNLDLLRLRAIIVPFF